MEHIEKIRSETHTALSSMETVNKIVFAIHQSQVTIASAVNQQSDMTLELSRSMSMMADTNQEITTTVQGLLHQSTAVRRHSTASVEMDRTVIFWNICSDAIQHAGCELPPIAVQIHQ